MSLFEDLHKSNRYEDILLAITDLRMRDFPRYRYCQIVTAEEAKHPLIKSTTLRVFARCGTSLSNYIEELEGIETHPAFIYWGYDEEDKSYIMFHFAMPEEDAWMATEEGCNEHEADFIREVREFRGEPDA